MFEVRRLDLTIEIVASEYYQLDETVITQFF